MYGLGLQFGFGFGVTIPAVTSDCTYRTRASGGVLHRIPVPFVNPDSGSLETTQLEESTGRVHKRPALSMSEFFRFSVVSWQVHAASIAEAEKHSSGPEPSNPSTLCRHTKTQHHKQPSEEPLETNTLVYVDS